MPACLSALVLLKDAAPEALAADNPGDLITAIKTSCHTCHDRDALTKKVLVLDSSMARARACTRGDSRVK